MVMSLVLEAGSWGTKFCLNFWLKLVAFTRFGESCLKAGYVLLAAVSPARSGSSLLEQRRESAQLNVQSGRSIIRGLECKSV